MVPHLRDEREVRVQAGPAQGAGGDLVLRLEADHLRRLRLAAIEPAA